MQDDFTSWIAVLAMLGGTLSIVTFIGVWLSYIVSTRRRPGILVRVVSNRAVSANHPHWSRESQEV